MQKSFMDQQDLPVIKEGLVHWKSPSNIAIIKYWGKKPGQLPLNSSLSFTLSNSFSECNLEFVPAKKKESGAIAFRLFFEGARQEKFEPKIQQFFQRIAPFAPYVYEFEYTIHSQNSFPHSSGIASSAAFFSALSLCVCNLGKNVQNRPETPEEFYQRASHFARLGSGSASRSIYGGWVIWGGNEYVKEADDQYAIPVPAAISPAFNEIQDTILIVSSTPKTVSSSRGHDLMHDHPYLPGRLKQVNENLKDLLQALEKGDVYRFLTIAENEALSLHGLMMSSSSSYTLLQPNTLVMLEKIRNFREKMHIPVGFTLDAGPNVHFLWFKKDEKLVFPFILDELLPLTENGQVISDHIGNGPLKI